MENSSVVSPYFSEDKYKGQDVVHKGIRIPLHLSLDEILSKFSPRALEYCKENGFKYEFLPLEDRFLPELRAMWFDPEDVTFPETVYGRIGWVCRRIKDGQIMGGIILKPSGSNLFLHQLIASEKGKHIGAPTRLIWYAVRQLHKSQWHSIDIGVSYNPKRYEFFKNFAVETYPIILKKPFYVPVIRLAPFRGFGGSAQGVAKSNGWFNDGVPFTTVPRGNYALMAALKHLSSGKDFIKKDNVVIVKTFGSDYIAKCVTDTIEKAGYTWSLRGTMTTTSVVLAIHEFGVPIFQERDIKFLQDAHEHKFPIIEDCAWRGDRVFDFSDYWFFSAQKMISINYGGVLKGIKIPDDKLWEYGCLDFVKKEMLEEELLFGAQPDDKQRIRNWERYHAHVQADGMMWDECYDYEEAVYDGRWLPTVYLQRFESDEVADAIVARCREFGIQAGRYWGEPVVFLPIHGNMTEEEVDYMFAVVKGYFNLCHDYGK